MRSLAGAAALLVLAGPALALKLNPNGKTVGFDLHQRARSESALRRRDTGKTVSSDLTFLSSFGFDYYVNFTMGTPGQPVAALVDTGSSDTWLPQAGSTICDKGCPLGAFDPTKSSTWKATEQGTFNNSYVDGSNFRGDFGTDTIQMGGVTLEDFTVGLAIQGEAHLPGSGFMGMGLAQAEGNALRGGTIHPTILSSLVSAGAIESNTFSIYNNEYGSPGSLLFGGIDTAKFEGELGIIDILPTAPGVYLTYTVALSGISFSNRDGGSSPISLGIDGSYLTILDSGSAVNILPDDITFAIYEGLGLEYSSRGAILPCDADLSGYSLNFTFGGPDGVHVGAPLSQFIQPYVAQANFPDIKGARSCQFAIQPMSGVPKFGGTVLIGAPFLRGTYAVFDLDNMQIALAPAIPRASSSNVIAIAGTASEVAASGAAAQAAGTDTPAAGTLPHAIPSATTVQGQEQVMVTPPASVVPATETAATPTKTASPTFDGVPKEGFSLTATVAGQATGSPNAAAAITPPWRASELTVSSVALMLMVMGGSLFALL